MQILSDRVRPEQGTYLKPWLNLGFVAGRASSTEMFEHGKKVFERATSMIDLATKAARNSGDAQMLRRVEELGRVWEARARAGVVDLGLRDLRTAVGQTTAQTANDFSRISQALSGSDVNSTARGLQRVLNPYARDIWGENDGVNGFDDLVEESKQYSNKSEAILMRPLWRRGLEWIWQAFGAGMAPRSTAGQLTTLRETVNLLYEAEMNGNDLIGNWFEDYSHKTFIVHVLAKARETGSINGIRTTIEHAITNPSSYSSYNLSRGGFGGGPSSGTATAPTTGTGPENSPGKIKTNSTQSSQETLEHFKANVDLISNELERISGKGDPLIKDLNYSSIEIIRSFNAFQRRVTNEEEMYKILDKLNSSFQKAAEKSKLRRGFVGGLGKHDFITQDADEALQNFKKAFRNNFREGIPNFKTEKEGESFFEGKIKEFKNLYQRRKELLGNLVKDKPAESDRPDFVAPVLLET